MMVVVNLCLQDRYTLFAVSQNLNGVISAFLVRMELQDKNDDKQKIVYWDNRILITESEDGSTCSCSCSQYTPVIKEYE